MKTIERMKTLMVPMVGSMLFFAASLTAGVVHAAPFDAEIAVPENAFTQTDFAARDLAFHRRTMVDRYAVVGSTNPTWDDAAVAYLEQLAKRLVDVDEDRGAPSYRELEGTGEGLTALGCDDPAVLYAYGRSLYENQKSREARPVLKRAMEGFADHPYPEAVQLAAMLRLQLTYRNDHAAYAEYQAQQVTYLTMLSEFFAGEEYLPSEARVFSRHIHWYLFGLVTGEIEEMYEKARNDERVASWVTDYIRAFHHKRAGWDARGKGFAHTVANEGWLGFHEYMLRAQEFFTLVWQERPDLPEAPAQMISVAMTLGPDAEADCRTWFDRAVAAQLDHGDSYWNLLWSLRPRWGGTHEQMCRFGQACRRTERYDTKVPMQFVEAVLGAVFDNDTNYAFLREPGVYENAAEVLRKTAAHPAHAPAANYYKSLHAAIAFRVEDYVEARRLFEELGEALDERGLGRLNFVMADARPKLYALGGPFAAEVRELKHLRDDGRFEQGLERVTALMEERNPDPPTLEFLRRLERELALRHQAQSGAWVDLTFNADLDGWAIEKGEWTAEDDRAVVATSTGKGEELVCLPAFTNQYALRCEIEPVGGRCNCAAGGFLFNHVAAGNLNSYCRIYLCFSEDQVALYQSSETGGRRWFASLVDTNRLMLEVWENHLNVHVNDAVVVAEFPLQRGPRETLQQVGLTGWWNPAGSQVRYRNLQIRRLLERPVSEALAARKQIEANLEQLDQWIAWERWDDALKILDVTRALEQDKRRIRRLDRLRHLLVLREHRVAGRATVVCEDTFDRELDPGWTVERGDPGLTIGAENGHLVIKGETEVTGWHTTGLTRDITLDEVVEMEVDIRMPTTQGLLFIGAAGMTHFFEKNRYATNFSDARYVDGLTIRAAFKDEATTWHTLRLVIDRASRRVFSYVDYDFMTELEPTEIPDTMGVVIGFQLAAPGYTAHALMDNFRISSYPAD